MEVAGAPTPIMYVSFLALSLAFTVGTVSRFDFDLAYLEESLTSHTVYKIEQN